MIIHNPIISGSIQFPADADGNKVTLQVNSGVLETIQIDSSNNATAVKPESNLSGSFTGSFQGDGSALTGVSAINIDALNALGGATVAQGDNLVISDGGTEKKVTFSNLEDSIFGNISGNATIAAGGVLTIASSFLNTSLNAATGSYLTTVDISTDTNLAVSDTSEVNMILTDDTLSAELIGGVVSGSAQVDYDSIQNQPTTITGGQASAITANTAKTGITSGQASAITANTSKTGITSGQASAITTNTSKVGYTDSLVKTKLDADTVSSGSAANIKSFLAIGSSDISDVAAFSQSGTYASLRAQSTTKGDVGLGSVDNTSDAGKPVSTAQQTEIDTKSDIASPTFTGTVGGITKGMVGLGNVDNTTDALKPVSTAGQTALNLKANLASPTLTGNPTAPTQADNDDSTKIATTAYVQREVSDLLGGAPAAFDTLLEISASIANGDSDVVALTTTVGTKLAKSTNLSDLANAGTARTNLGVDAAGTDNSTNVTLVTDSHDYLSVSGQVITLGSITNDDLAGSITNAKLSNSSITIDSSAISLGGSVTTLQLGTSGTTALAGNTTTISGAQASAITANTAKTGITSGQASAITANTAKTGITSGQTSAITANTAKTGITSGQTSAIEANTAKTSDINHNVSTDLSISGTTGARTIASSDGTDAIIPIATTSVSGLLSPGLFDEIDTNTAKTGITSGQASAITANTAKISYNSTASTKLGTIEGSADVTDTANVTSAGALMDSEVTNLADVKAFDTSDYATSAQGTKADAALPKGGGAMTGAITTNSTFDGRDVATDGTKLDTIESSADVTDTANVTSAGALMDSELSSISDIKALNQSVVSGATPTFTVTNFSDVSNKRFMSDAQETLLNSVETNADVTDTANVKSSLNASLGGSANIGDGSDTITIPGDLVVTGTTTTENVTTLTTSNGIVFEGSVADEHEATLKAGTLSADRTLTLPNATGTIALTSDLATVGAGGLTQQNFTTTLKNKLDGIEGSATADQSNAEIRAAVEAASDSNVFTDTDHSKLNAIEASADVTDTTNVTSAGALMDSEVTNLSQVKAFDSSDYLASSVTTISGGQASAITANTAKTGITSGQASAITANTAKTGITSGQASAITANTAKTGITSGQASAITANTAKISYNSTASTKLGTIETSATADQTAAEIRTLVGTGNNDFVPSIGTAGHFLKHDGTFGLPSYTTNTNTNTQLSQEQVEDFVGGMLGGTETGITVTYQDTTGDIDFVVATQSDVNFTSALNTKLSGIETSATADQSAAQIRSLVGTGNSNFVPVAGTAGHFLKHDGTFGLPSYTTNTNTTYSVGDGGLTEINFTSADNTKLDGIEASATADQTAAQIRSLVGTGNNDFVPSAGTVGHFLKHDGTFGLPSYTTNTDVSVSAANFKSRLAGGYAGNAAQIGDSGDTITIPGDLVVTGTTTTNNVETVSTSNGVVFEGNAADDNEITLLAATVSADRTITLPNASGTVALTSNIITNNNQITNGEGYISSFDITAQTDSKYLRSNANDTATGIISITNSTASTSKTTGALKVTGGVGISGALNVGGDIVAFASSDERLKDNIELISNPIEKVQSLKGVTWDWNSNADELQQSLPNVGVIAQDVEKILPQLVTDRDNGFKGVDYAKLTGLLIEAIKDQQKQIEELKAKIS